VPDVLSSLPYDHITLPWRRLPGDNPHHIVILLNIMPIVKLIRYDTLLSNIHYLFMVIFFYILIFNFLYFIHNDNGIINKCIFFFILAF